MTSVRNVILLATAGLLIAAPMSAHADCASPQAFFAPLEGTMLPTTGETYLFTPFYSWQKQPLTYKVSATVDGKRVAVTFEAASTAPGYRAWRVSWAGLAQGKLTLSAVDSNGGAVAERKLVLSGKWKKPAAVGPLVKSPAQPRVSAWSCSHDFQRHQSLEHAADVYRVTFRGSKARTQHFPANIGRFFGGEGKDGGVPLGHVSCFGDTHTWKGAVTVDVEALLPDGSTLSRSPSIVIPPPAADPNASASPK